MILHLGISISYTVDRLDGGATFPNIIKNLSGNAGDSFSPAIAVSGNNVDVVWDDSYTWEFRYLIQKIARWRSTFPNVIKNLSSDAGISLGQAIAVSGNNVYVVWSGPTSGSADILYRTSTDNGSTFPNVITNLSANIGLSASPKIAVS